MKKVILFAIVLCCWNLSYAADFNSLVEQAKQEYASGANLKAVTSLKAAVLSIWETVPLTVKNIRFVAGKDDYSTRKDNVYKAGDPIFITSELLGYQIKRNNKGNIIDMAIDLFVIDGNEKVISENKNFAKFHVVSPIPNTEFFLNLTCKLNGAPAGNYNLKIIVHDLNAGKSIDFLNKVQIQ